MFYSMFSEHLAACQRTVTEAYMSLVNYLAHHESPCSSMHGSSWNLECANATGWTSVAAP